MFLQVDPAASVICDRSLKSIPGAARTASQTAVRNACARCQATNSVK